MASIRKPGPIARLVTAGSPDKLRATLTQALRHQRNRRAENFAESRVGCLSQGVDFYQRFRAGIRFTVAAARAQVYGMVGLATGLYPHTRRPVMVVRLRHVERFYADFVA